jgi:tRNA(Ile)-lysidine synthetase-like protein
MDIQEAVRRAARRHQLTPAYGSLVIGVSGGADSLALLHALHALNQQHTLHTKLHVATLDHGLRGVAGAEDAQFVVDTAAAWGIPATLEKVDVRQIASEYKLGIEAAARRARYDFFDRVARNVGADRVAVAHHADDQAETVLMRLLRGAGIDGLAGMGFAAPLPYHPELTLIRPLLMVSRTAIQAYCVMHGLLPRHDATNEDDQYTRNFIRLYLLPVIEERFPEAQRTLVQLAEIASLERDFMEAALHETLIPLVRYDSSRLTLDRAAFEAAHPALKRRFILWAARELGAPKEIGYEHIVAAVETLTLGETGAQSQLPGNITIYLTRETIQVAK